MTLGQCVEVLKKLGHSDRVDGMEQQACMISAAKMQSELDRRRRKDARKKIVE